MRWDDRPIAGVVAVPLQLRTVRTLSPYVLRYLGERQRRGEISRATARNVGNHLWTLVEIFGNRPLDQLGPWVVDRYLEHCGHLAPSSRALRLSSVRGFARWLVHCEIVAKDFCRRAPKIRRRRSVPRTLDGADFARALAVCADTREQLILWLQYGVGLRCVEVSRLTMSDYDGADRVAIICGKGSHERELPIPVPVARAIDRYLAEGHPGTGPLIRSLLDPSRGISASRISGVVTDVIRRAGLKQRRYDGRSAHGWRAAAATETYEASGDLRVVQELLGHANISTTSVYLRRAGVSKIRDALDGRTYLPETDDAA